MSTKHKEEKTQCHSKCCLLYKHNKSSWRKITKLDDLFKGLLCIQKCKKCVCAIFCILFSKLLIVHVCVNKVFTFIINCLLFLPSSPALFFSYCFNHLSVAVITQWDLPEKFQENQNEKKFSSHFQALFPYDWTQIHSSEKYTLKTLRQRKLECFLTIWKW